VDTGGGGNMKNLTELLVLLARIVWKLGKLAYCETKWFAYEFREGCVGGWYMAQREYDLAQEVAERVLARKKSRKKATRK
ncbi:MAG: hypothetical protein NUV88_00460, partial [Candidatus Kaiserbacteria bacterium]|nr:hypothetical protein [Candidatus Kaiserbacteria bacterium]